MSRLGDAIRFAETHEDESEIRGKRGIVDVDGVEREVVPRGEFNDFGTGGLQFADQRDVLRLGLLEVGGVMETKFAPACDPFRLVPSCGLRGAHQHALQGSHHGASVESDAGLG